MGIGMVLGGALQGLGNGMAEQARSDIEQRRQMALENLRQSNDLAKIDKQGEINRQNTTLEYQQRDLNDARSTARNTQSRMAVDNNQAGHQRADRQQQFTQQLQLKQIDFKNDTAKLRLQSALGMDAARFQQGLEANEFADIQEGSDGQLYRVSKGGGVTALGISAPPKATSGGGTIAEMRNRGGSTAPQAATAKPTQTSGKTFTMEDVYATGVKYKMSNEAVIAQMQGLGYTLVK